MKLSAWAFALALVSVSGTAFAAGPSWPAEAGAKVPLNAMAIPTKLEPVDRSLGDILSGGGEVVNAYVGATGPVVTVRNDGRYTLCLVAGPDPKTDQNVPTSRCYGLN